MPKAPGERRDRSATTLGSLKAPKQPWAQQVPDPEHTKCDVLLTVEFSEISSIAPISFEGSGSRSYPLTDFRSSIFDGQNQRYLMYDSRVLLVCDRCTADLILMQ